MFNPAQEMSSIAFDKILGGALNAVISAQNNSSLTTVDFIKSVGFQNDENGNAVKPNYVEFRYPKEVMPYQPATPDQYFCRIEKSGTGYDESKLNVSGAYKVDGADDVVLRFVVDSNGGIGAVDVVSGGESLTFNNNEEEISKDVTLTVDDQKKDEEKATVKFFKRKGKAAQEAQFQDMTLQVPLLTIVPVPFIRVASTDIELNVKINSIYNSTESSDTNVKSGMNSSASGRSLFFRGNVSINASVSHQKKKSTTEDVKKEYSLNIKIHAVQDDVPAGMGRILDILEESIVPKLDRTAKAS